MKARYWPLALALVMALVVAFTVDDFVREVLVAPLLYASWLGVLVVRSLPTSLFWTLFVLAAAVVAVRAFARPPRPPQKVGARAPQGEGPLAGWYRRLQRSGEHGYSRWLLARDLRRLTGELLNPTDFFRLDEADFRRDDFEATLPPPIAAYFQAKMDTPAPVSWLWAWLRLKPASAESAVRLDPEVVIDFLESQVPFQVRPDSPTVPYPNEE